MKTTNGLAALALLGGCLWLVGSVPAADDKKDGSDKDFAKRASAAGLAEVNLGNLALARAHSAAVKDFARHMVAGHTRANRELIGLANTKSLSLAKTMDDKHRKLEDKLSKEEGAAFDRDYMAAMVKDHEAAVKLFEAESKHGADADLKAWAGKTLPKLKEHLKMAKDVAGKVKGK